MSSTHTTQVGALLEGLADRSVEIVDLTQPLSESTPVIKLPPPFANTPGLSREEISRYDDRGPAWAWYTLTIGEHVGTHLDAPIHWVTGRDGDDVRWGRFDRLRHAFGGSQLLRLLELLIQRVAQANARPDLGDVFLEAALHALSTALSRTGAPMRSRTSSSTAWMSVAPLLSAS